MVFDMAGTTVADGGIIETAVRDVCGDAFDQQAFVTTRGGSKDAMFEALLGRERAADAMAQFNQRVLELIRLGRIEPIAGAEACFSELRTRGIGVCLTTGFADDIRLAVIDHLAWNDIIDASVSSVGEIAARPAPDMINLMANHMEITDPTTVAVVGDTVNDLRAASAAGAGLRVGVLTGAHDEILLRTADPTHVVDSIVVMPDLIDEFNAVR